MNDLEQYYNEDFKTDEMPEFKELTEDHLKLIDRSMGYAIWKMAKAKDNMKTALRQLFLKNR